MSWSFEINGRDKGKLKAACRDRLTQSNPEAAPVAALIDQAIDAAMITAHADHMCVKSIGHADKTQCYFSIEVKPVYLPKLVD